MLFTIHGCGHRGSLCTELEPFNRVMGTSPTSNVDGVLPNVSGEHWDVGFIPEARECYPQSNLS